MDKPEKSGCLILPTVLYLVPDHAGEAQLSVAECGLLNITPPGVGGGKSNYHLALPGPGALDRGGTCRLSILRNGNVACLCRSFIPTLHVKFKTAHISISIPHIYTYDTPNDS